MSEKKIRIKTKEGLPLVTKETRIAFSKSLEVEVGIREKASSILAEWVDDVGIENPEVIKYISELIERFPEESRGTTLAFVFSVYELLKTQALNDKIRNYFGFKDKGYHT